MFVKKIKTTLRAHKFRRVLEWARNNVPDLPDGKIEESCSECNSDETGSYGIPCDTHAWGTPTEIPLRIPKKYKVYESRSGFSDTEVPQDAHLNLVESYRNYYRSKLRQLKFRTIKCPDCSGGGEIFYEDSILECHRCSSTGKKAIVIFNQWTNRKEPEWLK